MNSAKRSLQLAQLCARQFTTTQGRTAAGNVPAGYANIKAKQAKFQVKDGQLIFLKGGIMDKLGYQATMALSLFAVGYVLKVIWDLSVPAKPE